MSTISYEAKVREQEATRKAAALDAKNRAVFEYILAKYPIKEHEANYQMFLKFAGTVLTMESADYLMNPKTRPEDFQVDMTTRQALIEELVEMLLDPTERRMTAHDLHTRTVQLARKTLAELRAYRRSLTFKARARHGRIRSRLSKHAAQFCAPEVRGL